MIEPEPESTLPPPTSEQPRRRRMRRLLVYAAFAGLALIGASIGLYFWASSDSTQDLVRVWMVRRLEQATGGRVDIATFHWRLLNLEADAGGVVIHGREAANEAPFAQVD